MKITTNSILLFAVIAITALACQSNTAEVAQQLEEKIVNQSPKAINAALKTAGPGYEVGDQAMDFSLKGTDGKLHSLASIADAKGYILTFTCNTCPYAVMYEDRLIDLHKKYAPMGYPVVAINPNDPEVKPGDSFEKMQTRVEEKGFPFL